MAAELLSHTDIGGPIGAGSSVSGTGLIWGVYEVTSTENDDWIVLSEFDEIEFVSAAIISGSDIYTAGPVTVDTSTTNKIVLHAGSTNKYRIFVAGTPAVSS